MDWPGLEALADELAGTGSFSRWQVMDWRLQPVAGTERDLINGHSPRLKPLVQRYHGLRLKPPVQRYPAKASSPTLSEASSPTLSAEASSPTSC